MKLLVVEPRALFPCNTGARILSSNVIRHLSTDHDVTVLVNIEAGSAPERSQQMRGICREVITVLWRDIPNFTPRFYLELAKRLATGELYAVKKFCTPALKKRAVGLTADGCFDAVICDTMPVFMPDVEFGDTPQIVLDHNIEYRLRERQAKQASGLKACYLRYYARKTKRFEVEAWRKADSVVTVSVVDAEFIRREHGIESVTPLPPGVDAEYFAPREDMTETAEPSLVFTGSMDWQANQGAATFFVHKVLPKVKQALPNVKLTIVGRRPPRHITALAEADPDHVAVTGTVDDVRPYIAGAQVAVVPVLFGSGIKIKVFEAMAMAKPVVVSAIGAEGLPLVDGENALIADTADSMAERCIELLRDAKLRGRIGGRARATVCAGHDWSVVAAELARVCEDLARRRRKR